MRAYERCAEPEKTYSAAAFWFLNGRLEKERLKHQIDEMADQGVYQAFMHPRAYLVTPYLEEEWWDAIGACVTHAARTGFLSWLYDEYAWPSGTAGSTFEFCDQKPSRVLAKGRVNMAKSVRLTDAPEPDEHVLRTYYAPLDENAAPQIARAGERRPETGAYRELRLVEHVYPQNVDYMNPDAIRLFLDVTHEEYKKRYGAFFGKSIPGIFFDEIYMTGKPLPWTEKLPERFEERYGYSVYDVIPLLLGEAEGENARRARRDFFALTAELYENAFFRQISEWCARNRLILTGHTEEELLGHPLNQGHYFKTTRHLQMPGADCHDYRYKLPRLITLHEPKYSVSVARLQGAPRAMSEAMGGAGWGCSLQEFRRGVSVMGAMGISFFTLHGFYYECEHQGSQADWPTSFFYQNPYWPYFKQFADYMRRVSYMNAIGRAVVDCGLFYPVEELYGHMAAGKTDAHGLWLGRFFNGSLDALLNRQIDTDMIDWDGILRAECAQGEMRVGTQRFRALVLPACMERDEALFAAMDAFRRCGGTLVFVQKEAEIAPEPFTDCPHTRLEDLAQTVARCIGCDVRVLAGDAAMLYVNHRDCGAEGQHYMIANGKDERRTVTLLLRAKGEACLFSPETGRTIAAHARQTEEGVVVTLTLEPDAALYVLLGTGLAAQDEPLPTLNAYTPVLGRWSFLPGIGADLFARETTLELPIARYADERGAQVIRVRNTADEPGRIGRHRSAWRAGWITRRPGWVDESAAHDLYMCKTLTLAQSPEYARLCLCAVNHAKVYVNGVCVLDAESHERPLECDIRLALCAGENLIAVHVHNETPLPDANVAEAERLPRGRMTSLLLEGDIVCDGKPVALRTDETWAVADRAEAGWNRPGTEITVKQTDATRSIGFRNNRDYASGDWLTAWNRGCPPLLPVGDVPLFGRTAEYPAQAAYTVTLPAGTAYVEPVCVSGACEAYVDGMPQDARNGIALETDGRVHTLTLRVTADGPEDGLRSPVRVRLAPHRVNLGDWYREGLEAFAGKARYENTFTLPALREKRYFLSLGDVRFAAEVYVNGRRAGARVWEPYQIEVTELLREGENTFTVFVSNSAACERRFMLVDEGEALGWNRYWNGDNIEREPKNLVSGLIGEVRLYEV